jgi:4-aminobutyrate aminotransferase-like enzyme
MLRILCIGDVGMYSYSVNSIACAAGNAMLNEFDWLDLGMIAVARGARLRSGLERLEEQYPIVGLRHGVAPRPLSALT